MRKLLMTSFVATSVALGAQDKPAPNADQLKTMTARFAPVDLSADLRAGFSYIVVIDARSRDAYAAAHIPGAVNFPHREISAETTARLDHSKVYVVYYDGIGCNASTKGAYKLARLGFRAKELLGGIDWWRRDGHPVAASHEPGSLLAAE